jgi:hypothetical protein
MTFVGPRRRGRPKSLDPTVPLMAHLPASYYDRIARLALKHDVSVSSLASKAIQQAMDDLSARISRMEK